MTLWHFQSDKRDIFFIRCLSYTFVLHIILLCVVLPAHSSKKQQRVAEKVKIEKQLKSYNIKISQLQQRISSQKAQSEETVLQEKDVLEELEEIDVLLHKQITKVEDLETQVNEQQRFIEEKETELQILRTAKAKTQQHLKRRINAFYKMGKIDFLNVTFSARSLPELVKFHEAFREMIDYDKNLLGEYKNKMYALEQAKKNYVLEKELLTGFITTAHEESREMIRLRQEKRELLASIRTRKQLYDKAVVEMEQATKKITTKLVSLNSRKKELEQEFKLSKGELPPPLEGTIITKFNQEKTNKLGITRKSSGISIIAPDKTKVRAIADGIILYSGYLRGYGNTVIINHGYQYYTITSRLGRLLVHKGAKITALETIGQVSDTAMLIDEGVYFEVRHDKSPQDPLEWLDTSTLRFPHLTEAAIL